MGAVYFYHLKAATAEAALPALITRARGAGWRVELRGTDRRQLELIDERLWTRPEDGFLPHGMAGGANDAQQPVLLTLAGGQIGGKAANDPQCVMSLDGAEIAATEVKALERACIIFDGHDDGAVAHAREQWRALTGAGCAAQYWSDESGRWEKKAEAAAKQG